ncbi:hypothetical protein [Dongia sp.]|uniref:hypothetical protein n=1 Tax=Dongia sp. TaxID=1977262 RepID=UPI0035AF9490
MRRTHIPFIGGLFAAGLILATAAFPARAEVCPKPFDPPKITITTRADEPKFDHAAGIKILTREARDNQALPGDRSIYSMGLTRTEWSTSASIRMQGRPYKGGYCWSIVALEMTLIEQPTISIAKEIDRDSCSWKAVLAHERKHVAYNKRQREALQAVLPGKLQPALSGAETFKSSKDASASFTALAKKALEPLLKEASVRHQREQKRVIDTEAEYARVDAACPEDEWQKAFSRAGIN